MVSTKGSTEWKFILSKVLRNGEKLFKKKRKNIPDKDHDEKQRCGQTSLLEGLRAIQVVDRVAWASTSLLSGC